MKSWVAGEGEVIQVGMILMIAHFRLNHIERTPISDQEAPHHMHSMVNPVPAAGTATIHSTVVEVGGVKIGRVEEEVIIQVEEVLFSQDGVKTGL